MLSPHRDGRRVTAWLALMISVDGERRRRSLVRWKANMFPHLPPEEHIDPRELRRTRRHDKKPQHKRFVLQLQSPTPYMDHVNALSLTLPTLLTGCLGLEMQFNHGGSVGPPFRTPLATAMITRTIRTGEKSVFPVLGSGRAMKEWAAIVRLALMFITIIDRPKDCSSYILHEFG